MSKLTLCTIENSKLHMTLKPGAVYYLTLLRIGPRTVHQYTQNVRDVCDLATFGARWRFLRKINSLLVLAPYYYRHL